MLYDGPMDDAAAVHVVAVDHRDAAVARRLHAVLVLAHAQESALLQLKTPMPLLRTPADLQAGSEIYLGAFVGDTLVGAVSLARDDEPEQVAIATLVVHPAYQRRGVARALLEAALTLGDGVVFVVQTGALNAPALALYQRFGFTAYRHGQLGPEAVAMIKLRRQPPAAARLRHIGIVGCSAEGASLCYRTLCAEGARRFGAHRHPEVSMHTPPLADYVRCIDRGDWDGVAALMLASAEKLARIGAELLVCPDNTIHQAFALVEPRSPLPWLHIADVVADEAVARGWRRLGLLGTRWLVDSEVYPQRLSARGLACLRPAPAERDAVHRVIMDELVPGRAAPAGTATLLRAVQHLREQGCDAVVLGCTELPLVLDDGNSALPTLDSTRLLARAALQHAASPAPLHRPP